MRNIFKTALLSSAFAAVAAGGADPGTAVIRCDFDSPEVMKKEWRIQGAWTTLRNTKFVIVGEPTAVDKKVLAVEAKRSSGFLFMRIKGQDLKKYPYMRGRWRVVRSLKLPAGKEGQEPDDQPCVIYISARDGSKDNSVGYRWEFNTKVGTVRMIEYPFSKNVQAYCVRNRETHDGEWVEEERNVLEEYKAAFGKVPTDFLITIGGNSQHSKSDTRAEIDYIEFRSTPKAGK